jgi:hypothetical protein
MLTEQQRKTARELRTERPPVLAGTNVILNGGARDRWYDKVIVTMRETSVASSDVWEFCDIAGVPD